MAKAQTSDMIGTKKNQSGDQISDSKDSSSKKSGKQKTLEDLFEKKLKSMYDAEQQLVKALPEIAQAADNEELQDAINEHLQQTKRHVERLEKIFDRLQIDKSESEVCEVMTGLINSGKKTIEEIEAGPVRDSALIIGAQEIEHHEIAAYGSLCELADVLGHSKIADLLDRTLQEEEDTDKKLTYIAQDINDEAYEMSDNEKYELEEN
jgi:ferritin-like metal-binding protein YciE